MKTNPNLDAFEDIPNNHYCDKIISNQSLKLTEIRMYNPTGTENITSFSNIPEKGFFNIVCQICGICYSKNTKFLIVWDGTKNSM